MDRIEVTFPSSSAKCAAWLYYPTDTDNDVPCVVMAHGFSLTRHDGLPPYAEAFTRAGAAVMVYDHRFIGDSEGEPRQLIRPYEQLEDRRGAVAFARTLDGIDQDRIVVWGYSMSAGTALTAATTDPRIAGAILLCPLLDARWRSNRGLLTQPRNAAWMTTQAIKDIIGNALVPVAAQPGCHGVLTFPGELDGFHSITAPGSPWRNEVRAAPVPGYSLYRPLANARKLNCPILTQAGDRDLTVSPGAVDKLPGHREHPRSLGFRPDVLPRRTTRPLADGHRSRWRLPDGASRPRPRRQPKTMPPHRLLPGLQTPR